MVNFAVLRKMRLLCLVLLMCQTFWACNGGSNRDGRKHIGTNQTDTLAVADSLTAEFLVGRDFKLRVYLDNSASMQGYLNVKDGSEFLRFVDDYVSTIAIKYMEKGDKSNIRCKGVEFFLLDTAERPLNVSYKRFSTSLVPNNFTSKQSETASMIRRLLELQNEEIVTLFFTDGMFTSRKNEVGRIPVQVKAQIAECLSAADLDTKLIRLQSEFVGKYWPPKSSNRPNIDAIRPYFCWVIGHPAILSELACKEFLDDLHGVQQYGYQEFLGLGNLPVRYTVFRDPRGRYKTAERDQEQNQIFGAKRDKQGNFSISLGFTPNTKLLAPEYILNPENYEITPSVFDVSIIKQDKGSYKYKLVLSLQDDAQIPEGEIAIALKRSTPNWDSYNENDGVKVEEGKTYHLDYLVDGIKSAYELQYGKHLMELRIKNNK